MLTVAILAAGKGTRMASSLPKVLHKLSGKTLIQRRVQEQLSSNLMTSKKWRAKWGMTK